MAAFGKTISNGVPMAALIGKREIMENAKKTFIVMESKEGFSLML